MSDPADISELVSLDAEANRGTSNERFGITSSGFLPKPFARLLAEKMALARTTIGADVDLSSGSVLRKLLELASLEDARTWAALGTAYDDSFVVSATGSALSDRGSELGIPRPFECADGTVQLTLIGALPAAVPSLVLPRGSRLATQGGHRAALASTITLSSSLTQVTAPVTSFDPGPVGNLDPTIDDGAGNFLQKLDRWVGADESLAAMRAADVAAGLGASAGDTGAGLVRITHTTPLTGGERTWADEAYRAVLLRAPRGLWSADAIASTVSLIPGVRQVAVRDGWGGLDLSKSIFGDFDFIERLFAAPRDLSTPYYVTVLVAPTSAAIWAGVGGLRAAIEQALRDVRPVGIFPDVVQADEVYVAVQAQVLTRGLTLPLGTASAVNHHPSSLALKDRFSARLHAVVDGLALGEPVRNAAVLHALMTEPGVTDVTDLRLVRFPRELDAVAQTGDMRPNAQVLGIDENLRLGADQIAVLVDRPELLVVR